MVALPHPPKDVEANVHKWEFKARFRQRAFGWKSQPAIQRIKEAVSEIKRVARKDKLLAAEGAVLFLERVSPALEQVDSSSGAIGTTVNKAITELVPIIAAAPTSIQKQDDWLERLWQAYQDDGIPYIELLGDYWGGLCVTKDLASRWADRLIDSCKMAWSPCPILRGSFKATTSRLSALVAAERYQDTLDLLEMAPYKLWHYRQFGVKALVAMGKKAEAIRYAEQEWDPHDSPTAIALICEEILLSSGLIDEAYARYGLLANRAGTYLAWFRAVAKKYPHKKPSEILEDLVEETPGEEGKWFAAAKDAKLFEGAVDLANRTPCSPQTLTRATRDFAEKNPLLDAVVARVESVLESTYPRVDLPPTERLERFVEARSTAVGNRVGMLRLVISEQFLLALPKSGSAQLTSCVQKTRDFVLACLREGQRTGEFRTDVDASVLAVVVMGTIQMLALSTSNLPHRSVEAEAVRAGLLAMLKRTAPTRPKRKGKKPE